MAKVLLIDDEPNVLNYLRRVTEKQGHSVVTASCSSEALAAMADASVDIIVSDVYLSNNYDGGSWLEAVKEKAGGRPFVFITGYPDQELVAASEKLGATALLSKPFELSFLKELLAKLSAESCDDK